MLKAGVAPWIATVVACLCSFMIITDGAVVSLALSAIRKDFGLSLLGQQWIVDAEKLTLGGFMLLTARAGDLFGRRRVLLGGLSVFMVASLTSALATGPAVLIGARALQGIGASALATSTLAIIFSVYTHAQERDRATGIWTAAGAAAATFGFLAGGALIGALGWRWAMLLNLPVGAVLGLIVATCFSPPPTVVRHASLDVAGAVSITVAVACLLYAITHVPTLGWRSWTVVATALGTVLSLVAFVRVQKRIEAPLIPLGVFRRHNVLLGIFLVACLGATLSGSMFFIPVTLQQAVGYSPVQSGAAMLPLALLIGMAPQVAGGLGRKDFRLPPFVGGLATAGGLFWLSRLSATPVYLTDLLGPTCLIGAGIGLSMVAVTRALMASVGASDAGLASGLQNTARQLGGAIGIAGLVAFAHAVSAASGMDQATAAVRLLGFKSAFGAAAGVSLAFACAALCLARDETA